MGKKSLACANCGNQQFSELVKARGNRGVKFISNHHHVVVCQNCGLVFINPQHEDQDYQAYYEALNYREEKAMSKEKILKKHLFKKIPLKFLTDHLASERRLEEQLQVIDIGCGFGEAIKFMQSFGLKAEGLEPSASAADFARTQFGADVMVGSIFNHDLPRNHYDIVTSLAVIEHVTDPIAALREMRRLIKPNGLLFVNTPDLKGMVLRKGVDRYFKFVHTYYYTNVTLSSLLQLAGFEILKTWQMRPILKYSNLFNPTNFKEGELNIIAQKKDLHPVPAPLKDNVEEIVRILDTARKRDLRYSRFNGYSKKKIAGFPFRYARKRLVKPQFVFRDYFRGPEVVSDYQTI